ncbi:MAG TPA: hypothetical protein VGS99_09805 [Gammaproteobacteria bacterium]|nr:hypothetical protein [Gammaproteobacteria bacterium]
MSASPETVTVRARSLYALALALDLLALLLLLLQAIYWLAAPPASKGVLILIGATPLITLLVLAVMPSRVTFQPESEFPRHSLLVWANLALPLALGGLSLLLVGLSGRFDDYAGLVLFLAIVAGYHLRECLRAPGRPKS